MTDARYPERWLHDRRLRKLSDAGFRAFVNSLAWSVLNRTDGVIEPDDLMLIPDFDPGCEVELVKTGAWTTGDGNWHIMEFADTQTSSTEHEALAALRKTKREAQARWRAKQAKRADQLERDGSIYTVDSTRESTEIATTQDRTGQDRSPVLSVNETEEQNVTSSPSKAVVVTNRGTSPAEPTIAVRELARSLMPTNLYRSKVGRSVVSELSDLHGSGADIDDLSEALSDWMARTDVKPWELREIYTDLLKRRSGATRNGHRMTRTEEKTLGYMALGRQPDPKKGLPR